MAGLYTEDWTDEAGNHQGGHAFGPGFAIAWQRGPNKDGRQNGAYMLTVLEALIRQMEYCQSHKFNCYENAIALNHLCAARDAMEDRRDRRKAEGTLGTHEV